MKISYESIGVMHCELKEREDAPLFYNVSDIKGEIEVFEQFAAGLQGIERNDYIAVIFHFHRAGESALVLKHHRSGKMEGVFNLCSPRRPNSIGLSILKLEEVRGNRLLVDHVDMLDGTPILDIKPYKPSDRT